MSTEQQPTGRTVRLARLLRLLGCALLLLICAAILGLSALWVPAVALIGVCLFAALWVIPAGFGVDVRCRYGAERVVEGQLLPFTLVVSSRIGLPGGNCGEELDLRTGRRRTIGGGAVEMPRRGVARPAPPIVTVRDPLGLVEVVVSGEIDNDGGEILVLPRVEPVESRFPVARVSALADRRAAGEVEAEVDGLRSLREGTPASRIYWPSIARGGDPQERRVVGGGDHRPLIVLDTRGDGGDSAVRAAASLALHLAENGGGCLVLLPGNRRPIKLDHQLAGWDRLLMLLALVPNEAAPGIAPPGHRGTLITVSGHGLAALPRRSRRVHVVVLAEPIDGRTPDFFVAGCAGYLMEATVAHRSARRAA